MIEKERVRDIAEDLIDFLGQKTAGFPGETAMAILVGTAVCAMAAYGLSREGALQMVHMCFDDIEAGGQLH